MAKQSDMKEEGQKISTLSKPTYLNCEFICPDLALGQCYTFYVGDNL